MDKFLALAKKCGKERRFEEATNIIVNLDFFKEFDMQEIIKNLAMNQQILQIRKIIDKQPDTLELTVRNLSTKENVKMANKLVKDYKLNANDFPEMQGIQESNATNFYVSSIFRKSDHPAYMPLNKVEDLFEGKHRMLINLVESLLRKKSVH